MNIDFQKNTRQALNHLYNPDQLRKNPLVEWFGYSARYDAPSTLQQTLIDAIQSLRPGQYEPGNSDARKTYEILLMRYIQQFNQQEVAHHIGVSERQFRREQDRAINILSDYLWKKYAPVEQPPAAAASPETYLPSAASREIDPEWGWLQAAHSERVSGTVQFIKSVLDLIRPVADQYHARIRFEPSDGLPDLAVHPVAFRQVLLNLLRIAIAHARDSEVCLQIQLAGPMLEMGIQACPSAAAATQLPFGQEDYLFHIASRLTELSRGRLSASESEGNYRSRLLMPVVDGVSVLVVDDNRDIIELLQRYTTGTRYRVTGLEDPTLAFESIQGCDARIVILDVMMPKIDGWELLGRLRQHPLTGHLPVIILSVLAQDDLALSLGARALVVKPVTQERLLAVLDQVFAAQS
jgi:CheY-like chemotaxis protein